MATRRPTSNSVTVRLKRRRDVIAHIDAALATGSSRKVVRAFQDAARSKGSLGAIKRLGITPVALRKRFDTRGGPEIDIALAFVRALGRRLVVVTE
jgi:DNA-binding phage protein